MTKKWNRNLHGVLQNAERLNHDPELAELDREVPFFRTSSSSLSYRGCVKDASRRVWRVVVLNFSSEFLSLPELYLRPASRLLCALCADIQCVAF